MPERFDSKHLSATLLLWLLKSNDGLADSFIKLAAFPTIYSKW